VASVAQLPVKSRTAREKHRVDALVRDERVQRSLIPTRVRRLQQEMNLDGIGVITVNRRIDGALVILDGQHRVQALIDNGMGEWKVECLVHLGLSLAEEAAIFRLLNNTRRALPYDDFTKGVLAGDEDCVAINEIVEAAGLSVADQKRDGTVCAVTALRRIYALGGGVVLATTLDVATTAWGRTADAADGQILTGIGTVIARYGDAIETSVLVRKLAKRPGGVPALIGDARGLSKLEGGAVARGVARLIVLSYNRGKRSQLPAL
jgi:hypothetical protein